MYVNACCWARECVCFVCFARVYTLSFFKIYKQNVAEDQLFFKYIMTCYYHHCLVCYGALYLFLKGEFSAVPFTRLRRTGRGMTSSRTSSTNPTCLPWRESKSTFLNIFISQWYFSLQKCQLCKIFASNVSLVCIENN